MLGATRDIELKVNCSAHAGHALQTILKYVSALKAAEKADGKPVTITPEVLTELQTAKIEINQAIPFFERMKGLDAKALKANGIVVTRLAKHIEFCLQTAGSADKTLSTYTSLYQKRRVRARARSLARCSALGCVCDAPQVCARRHKRWPLVCCQVR